ncbi:MAG: DedA family protein [Phycisphaerales bacterium]|nr:DedA family protein [Phycisphaerales bacterium]MCB9856784.1 DedA family protein [Phycisphaerales bacterium]MCB9862089.1 DedA family protein [Phycisphaerales bacterium]
MIHEDVFQFLSTWSFPGLFFCLLAAGFGVPIPEDIPLILSGFVVRESYGDATMPLIVMCLTGLAGVIAGDSVMFLLGRKFGPAIVEMRWFRRIAKPWLIEKAREKYDHHGAKILFAGRFMPGLRCVLFLSAGVFRLPYWKLLAFDGTAAVLSVPLWVWAGWFFHAKLTAVYKSAKIAAIVIGGIALALLVAWVIYEYYRNLRKKGHEDLADPHVGAEILAEASGQAPHATKAEAAVSHAMTESVATRDPKSLDRKSGSATEPASPPA